MLRLVDVRVQVTYMCVSETLYSANRWQFPEIYSLLEIIQWNTFCCSVRLLTFHMASVNGRAALWNHQDPGESICIVVTKFASQYFSLKKKNHFALVIAVVKYKGTYTGDHRKAYSVAKANELQNLNQYLLENACGGHSALLLRPLQTSLLLDLALQIYLHLLLKWFQNLLLFF